MTSSAGALMGVINDILDFSKIEAGKLEFECAPFALRELLAQTSKALALRTDQKGLELFCVTQGNVPDRVIGDSTRLRQVLTNLLVNAIKFTMEGEIVVSVRSGASRRTRGLSSLRRQRYRNWHTRRATGTDLQPIRAG